MSLVIFVGQAFQPDYRKRQAGKPDLWNAGAALVATLCRLVGFFRSRLRWHAGNRPERGVVVIGHDRRIKVVVGDLGFRWWPRLQQNRQVANIARDSAHQNARRRRRGSRHLFFDDKR